MHCALNACPPLFCRPVTTTEATRLSCARAALAWASRDVALACADVTPRAASTAFATAAAFAAASRDCSAMISSTTAALGSISSSIVLATVPMSTPAASARCFSIPIRSRFSSACSASSALSSSRSATTTTSTTATRGLSASSITCATRSMSAPSATQASLSSPSLSGCNAARRLVHFCSLTSLIIRSMSSARVAQSSLRVFCSIMPIAAPCGSAASPTTRSTSFSSTFTSLHFFFSWPSVIFSSSPRSNVRFCSRFRLAATISSTTAAFGSSASSMTFSSFLPISCAAFPSAPMCSARSLSWRSVRPLSAVRSMLLLRCATGPVAGTSRFARHRWQVRQVIEIETDPP